MKMKMARIVLLLGALILLAVFAYREYAAQELRAQLLTGTVEATRVEVSTKESGYIEELFLQEGMTVRAGDAAARIGRRDLDAAVLRDEAALAHAETSLQRTQSGNRAEEIRAAAERTNAARAAAEKADADYARGAAQAPEGVDIGRLTESGSRPEDIRMAEEDVRRQQAILEIDASAVSDLTVRVPKDGIVLSKNYERGEFVRAGTPIATLIDPQDVWVKVYVTTDVLGDLRIGNPAKVYIDGQMEPLDGTIKEISDAAEFTLRQRITKNERANLVFGVKVAVDNAAGILKPGMPADVDLEPRNGT